MRSYSPMVTPAGTSMEISMEVVGMRPSVNMDQSASSCTRQLHLPYASDLISPTPAPKNGRAQNRLVLLDNYFRDSLPHLHDGCVVLALPAVLETRPQCFGPHELQLAISVKVLLEFFH